MVHESVLDKLKDENLSVQVVWTPVLASDKESSVNDVKDIFAGDKRVSQYWDGEQALGQQYGKVVQLPRGRDLAWDIYFLFDSGREWSDALPEPDDWQHQLGLDERYLNGDKLREALKKRLEAID